MKKQEKIVLPRENEINFKVGKLTIIESFYKPSKNGRIIFYKVLCECGKFKNVKRYNILNGSTKSCGRSKCLSTYKHGLFSKYNFNDKNKNKNQLRTDEYICWDNLKRRSKIGTIQNSRGNYHKISPISKEWESSFELFLKDMGKRPSKNHSIERIDNSKGYSKENCKWATHKEQMRNTSRTYFINYNNENLCMTDFCEKYSINYNNFRYYRRKFNNNNKDIINHLIKTGKL